MSYYIKILFPHSIVIISLFLYSCGTQHSIRDDVIYKDDNFSYNLMMKSGVVIGGIASQEINFTKDERNKFSSHLSTILTEQLKDVHIINTSQLTGRIGKEKYFSIMKEYDDEQQLIDENMRGLKESLSEIGYIIFAYIRSENIRNESYTDYTKNDEGDYKTVYKTTYSLTVDFRIYDVLKEQLVWNNLMYNEAVKTQNRSEDNFLSVVVGDVISGASVTIDREDVLEEMYEKFAEDLVEINN